MQKELEDEDQRREHERLRCGLHWEPRLYNMFCIYIHGYVCIEDTLRSIA